MDWVFPDTTEGIQRALALGANILWLNTILFETHPVQQFLDKGLMVVGQDPDLTGKFDDKWDTNQILKSYGLPIPTSAVVSWQQKDNHLPELKFLAIAKPIRGRGSAGVTLVENAGQLAAVLEAMLGSGLYGNAIMLEEYLPDKK